jgi:cysteinyl-tRNA synthetase, unknown class
MLNITSWGYQSSGLDSLAQAAIRDSRFDLVVVDYSADGSELKEFTPVQIHNMSNSGNPALSKLLVARMSLGEAELGRFYFNDAWVTGATIEPGAPAWLHSQNPTYPDRYKVEFWDPEWQSILFNNTGNHPIIGNAKSYLDRILDAGFYGVYLDLVEAFEFFGPSENGGLDLKRNAAPAMVSLIEAMSIYAKGINPDFLIIPHGGISIITNAAYPADIAPPGQGQSQYAATNRTKFYNAIDAVGTEDVFHPGPLDENNPHAPDLGLIGLLNQVITVGRSVLALEYLSDLKPNPHLLTFPAVIDTFYSEARAEGYRPYATVRALDVLTVNPSQELQASNDYSIFMTPDNGATEVEIPVPDILFAPIVIVGQEVREFEALTDAISILDEINDPGWWETNIGLIRYISDDFNIGNTSNSRATFLKSLLKYFNMGIKLKEFNRQIDGLVFSDLALAGNLLKTASQFLKFIQPVFTHISILGNIEWEEGLEEDPFAFAPDFMSPGVEKTMHYTIPNNPVNLMVPPDALHPSSTHTDVDAYRTSGGTVPYDLDGDALGLKDTFTVSADFGTGFHQEGSGAFESWRNGVLADVTPPELLIRPSSGRYVEPFYATASANEAAEILYTLDGTDPAFEVPGVSAQKGFRMLDKVYVPRGKTEMRFLARDPSNNVTDVIVILYRVIPEIEETVPAPGPKLDTETGQHPDKASPNVVLSNTDKSVRVWYTTDGSDPSDITFTDDHKRRLNGLKLEFHGPVAITINDPAIPIDFVRGRASVNLDGLGKGFALATRPFRRYFGYAIRQREGRWITSFSSFNTEPLENTDERIMIGFAFTDARGEFSQEAITNVVDTSSAPLEMVRDPDLDVPIDGEDFLPPGVLPSIVSLNDDHPIELPTNAGQIAILRYFSLNDDGLYDPTKIYEYEFDTTPAKTRLEWAVGDSPFPKTLVVNIVQDIPEGESAEDLTIFWSTSTVAPERHVFGQHEKLRDPVGDRYLSIELIPGFPNTFRPNRPDFTITFVRRDILGNDITLTATQDLKDQEPLEIPVVPNSLFDITVVPDFEIPNRWRFEVSEPNEPAVEDGDRILVAQIWTDEAGVLDWDDPLDPKGGYAPAVHDSVPPPYQTKIKTNKLIRPVRFDITNPAFEIVFSWFSEDTNGNAEPVQTRTFKVGSI